MLRRRCRSASVVTTAPQPRGRAGGDARVAGRAARRPARAVAIRTARSRSGRELAGRDGVVLVTGSIYLISDLLRPGALGRGRRCEGAHGPSVRAMIAGGRPVVALVILVFFGIGYLFGRLFL